MKKFLVISTSVVLVLALTTSAWAVAGVEHEDGFWIELNADNTLVGGGGSGWSSNGNQSGLEGEWIYYPNPGGVDWWNQWFYDDPPDPNRWKEIWYDIQLVPGGGMSFVEVAINWSNLQYPATGPDGDPPGPEQEGCIEREIIFSGEIDADKPLIGEFVIPDYNPEWVSIDVRYDNPDGIGEPVYMSGTIWHKCVPEPGTVVGLIGLALMAGLALLRRGK